MMVYVSKNEKEKKEFEELEWLFPPEAGCSHIPDKGMQMVHYYRYYSLIERHDQKYKKIS